MTGESNSYDYDVWGALVGFGLYVVSDGQAIYTLFARRIRGDEWYLKDVCELSM